MNWIRRLFKRRVMTGYIGRPDIHDPEYEKYGKPKNMCDFPGLASWHHVDMYSDQSAVVNINGEEVKGRWWYC